MRTGSIALVFLASTACVTLNRDKSGPGVFERLFSAEWRDYNASWIDLSPDGTRVLLASSMGAVRLYSEASRKPVDHLLGETLIGARFLDHGAFTADREGVTFWNEDFSRRAEEIHIPTLAPDLTRTRVALSASRRYVAIDDAVYDTTTKVWVAPRIGHGHQTALSFAGDAFVLTAGFQDRQVVVRGLRSGEPRVWKAAAPVTAALITSDGKLVVATTSNEVVSWDPATDEPQHRAAARDARDVKLCGEHQLVAIVAGRTVRLLHIPGLEDIAIFDLDAGAAVLACDGWLLAAGDESGRVYVWDLVKMRLLAKERLLPASVAAIEVEPSHRRLFVMSNDEKGAHGLLLQIRR